MAKVAAKRSRFPELQIVTNFHRSIALIDHTVKLIDEHLKVLNQQGKSPDRLLLSFHGIQKRRINSTASKRILVSLKLPMSNYLSLYNLR